MGCVTGVAKLNDLTCIFGSIVSNLLMIGGLISFVMLLAGGFKYITSAGDPKAVAGAQTTITYAVMGMIAVALSYIAILLISYFTGNQIILNFTIYQG